MPGPTHVQSVQTARTAHARRPNTARRTDDDPFRTHAPTTGPDPLRRTPRRRCSVGDPWRAAGDPSPGGPSLRRGRGYDGRRTSGGPSPSDSGDTYERGGPRLLSATPLCQTRTPTTRPAAQPRNARTRGDSTLVYPANNPETLRATVNRGSHDAPSPCRLPHAVGRTGVVSVVTRTKQPRRLGIARAERATRHLHNTAHDADRATQQPGAAQSRIRPSHVIGAGHLLGYCANIHPWTHLSSSCGMRGECGSSGLMPTLSLGGAAGRVESGWPTCEQKLPSPSPGPS